MKEEYKSLVLEKNEDLQRFELNIDGSLAFIEYREKPGAIALIHTEVDPALEGKGAGTAIVEKTLEYIEGNGLKLIPLCPFVASYLKRHPGWQRIIASES